MKSLYPKVYLVFIICFISTNGVGQTSFIEMFVDIFRPTPDFSRFKTIKFTWNIPGNVQVVMNEGLTHLDNDKPSLATISFDQVITKAPTFWAAYYYRAMSYRLNGELDKAVSDLKQAAYLNPAVAEVYFALGECYEGLYKLQDADDYYKKALKLDNNFAEAYYGRGNVDYMRGNLRAAMRNYKRCSELKPAYTLSYLMQGFIELSSGKKSESIEMLNKGLAIDSLQSKFLLLRALISLSDNKLDTSLKDLDQFVKLNPQNQFFLFMRGFIHLELKDFDRSYNDLRKAVLMVESDENLYLTGHEQMDRRIDVQTAAQYALRFSYGLKEEALAHFKKGFCYFMTQQYKIAIDHFTIASHVEPSATIYYLKAITFEHSQKHDSAYVYYDKALALDNEIFDAHKKRGIYRHELKNWKGAYADFNEMIKQHPEIYGTYRLRGLIKYNLKDYYGALIDFTTYLKKDSTNAEIYKSRGACRSEIKDYIGSTADYRMSLKYDSTDYGLYLAITDNYLTLNDTVTALAVLDTVAALRPADLNHVLKRIGILIAMNHWNAALKLISDAFKTAERNPFYILGSHDLATLYHYRGEIFFHQKNHKAAVKDLGRSIEIKPFQLSRYLRAKSYLALGEKQKAKTDLQMLAKENYKDAETLLSQLQ